MNFFLHTCTDQFYKAWMVPKYGPICIITKQTAKTSNEPGHRRLSCCYGLLPVNGWLQKQWNSEWLLKMLVEVVDCLTLIGWLTLTIHGGGDYFLYSLAGLLSLQGKTFNPATGAVAIACYSWIHKFKPQKSLSFGCFGGINPFQISPLSFFLAPRPSLVLFDHGLHRWA